MKVKVKVKYAPLTQVEEFLNQALAETQDDLAAAYAENEALFQKNRDLERQIVCMERDFQAMKKRHSDACADRDNLEAAYKQVQASIGQIVHNFEDTRKELEGEVKRVCKEKQELYSQLTDKNEEVEALQRVAEENEKRKDEITELYDENCNLHLQLDGAEKVIESLETQLTRAELCNTALESRLEEVTVELLKHEMGHYKRECEEWKQTADELADQLKDAHDRIAEQQRTIADCSDTIVTLKTTAELRPQFSNLWQLLKDTGMIIDTEGGVHNHE